MCFPYSIARTGSINLISTTKKYLSSFVTYYFQFQVVAVSAFQIRADCRKRIEPGTAVQLFTKCSGCKDKLREDSIRLTIKSGLATVHMIFPIAVSDYGIISSNPMGNILAFFIDTYVANMTQFSIWMFSP